MLAARVRVFVAGQCNDREPLAYAANKEHGLFTTDTVFTRHARERRVQFSQAVRSAAAGGLIESYEQIEAGLVVDVIAVEHRHEDRGIEKPLHSPLPRFAKSRSSWI